MLTDTLSPTTRMHRAVPISSPHTSHKNTQRVNRREVFGVLFITSYPPRECGIATYSQDLIAAINHTFARSFAIQVCALESGNTAHIYPDEVKYILNTQNAPEYPELAHAINVDPEIQFVWVQHEFGFFGQMDERHFLPFLNGISKPVILVFHTVLLSPDEVQREKVRKLAAACQSVVVMTQHAAKVLETVYKVPAEKIHVIPHGTHLVPHLDKDILKEKYRVRNRKILSTFGLLSSGKGIETTLHALPSIIASHPDVLFLIIGKTHPGVVTSEGETYRDLLEALVSRLNLGDHVRFINRYLPLPDLLEYLQLTDIYLFTSKDPNQAVSGTFSYAMSCGCAIISTPIPHAREALAEDTGIIIDFQHSQQLSSGVSRLLDDELLRVAMASNALKKIVPTAWGNAAIAHALLMQETAAVYRGRKVQLTYRLPEINLAHVKKMTTGFAMIQFSQINQPDISSGYTLDDNARALIALCMHYELTGDETDLPYIRLYLDFMQHCQQREGHFLNYVDVNQQFTPQNDETNLSDSNGRAVWALGYLISMHDILPAPLCTQAEEMVRKVLPHIGNMHSPRAMAFAIKGLYYVNLKKKSSGHSLLVKVLANRLLQMYRHESETGWQWYESYLTYANSLLPEAMLCAWAETGNPVYKETAIASFDFLLSHIFSETGIKVASNQGWLHKGHTPASHGEQPIDVAYTVLALSRFYDLTRDQSYLHKIETAFSWFLGNNHLHQIIYNPCTGGCYDGLEETHVNLNQGAESALSYLMARLIVEGYPNAI
ncbi:MAG: glycosyltransferase [Bacteroidetes bacterium]|nr:MAG: glycosyltransferase [Bacteroidota bacterium]